MSNKTSGLQQQRKPREAAVSVKYYPIRTVRSLFQGLLKAVERKTNHSLESQETRSQASRQKHWLFCVSK